MLEINASKINNVVTFTVDHNSLREAKKAGEDLQKYFQSIAEPKLRFKQIRERQRKAEALADNAKFNTSPSSTSELKQQQRIADKAAKTQAREAAKIAKRNETADIKFKSAGLQLRGISGKYNVDPTKQYEALKFIQEQTEQFRKGVISSQRMNFTIRERITDLRREAALQARITASTQQQAAAQRKGKRMDYKGAAADIKERGLNLIGGGPGFLVATAALAGGGALLGRVRNTANDNLDLVRKSDSVKVNPNAVKTLVQANRQRGIDSNVDTITDNFKDVRERLGESAINSQLDPKSGKYKGGNGAIDQIMNEFGWSKEDIAKYQDNPLDFVQAVVNAGQAKGMSDASIGFLLEDLGNDLSYLVPVLKNNGEEYNTTLEQLTASGQTLNAEQIKQIYAYGELSKTMDGIGNGLDQSLTSGFLDGFGNAGDGLAQNTEQLNRMAKGVGSELGNLLAQLTNFTSEVSKTLSVFDGWMREHFPELFTDPNKPAAQQAYDEAVVGSSNWVADKIQDATGFDTRSIGPAVKSWLGIGDDQQAGTAVNQYNLAGDSLRDSALSSLTSSVNTPSFNLAPVFNLQVNPQVGLTLESDVSRLSDYIDFNAKASADSFTRSLTLSALSGQSTING
ncbi:hypothetical protein [Leclercia adecarboxylata]|uniref:hypothetical protein n=1 Tax=Leclercia adecarboxylata TaxID=83655 RepID=UPI00294A86DD|nr:hypothetical protein [Leclercia adecarboxylata]MDV5238154.1 hypothetical protein [Leclercia adecarboxylata]MDV5279017.1 hypothetical protein [Leclercia adecarboxylata]MDV5462723.1 hypothetical protein [Leclercia adecarboxylata]MDV5502129.1 hypothetical protein [Leclercia adecarboxylata]MDV5530710.1 hypothetical protein [Leclercia adecarboxylata]